MGPFSGNDQNGPQSFKCPGTFWQQGLTPSVSRASQTLTSEKWKRRQRKRTRSGKEPGTTQGAVHESGRLSGSGQLRGPGAYLCPGCSLGGYPASMQR